MKAETAVRLDYVSACAQFGDIPHKLKPTTGLRYIEQRLQFATDEAD